MFNREEAAVGLTESFSINREVYMNKRVVFLTVTFLLASFLTACATTGYVASGDEDGSQQRTTATALRERK